MSAPGRLQDKLAGQTEKLLAGMRRHDMRLTREVFQIWDIRVGLLEPKTAVAWRPISRFQIIAPGDNRDSKWSQNVEPGFETAQKVADFAIRRDQLFRN
jgi:hypothetical protein